MGKLSHHADHLSLAFSAWSHSAEMRKQHVAFTHPGKGGWRQVVLGAAPYLIAGGGCNSAWCKENGASLIHNVNSRRDFLPCPISLVQCPLWQCCLTAAEGPIPSPCPWVASYTSTVYCSVLLSFKSSTFNFHMLNPGLGKLCCVWGMMFHHSPTPALSGGTSSQAVWWLTPLLGSTIACLSSSWVMQSTGYQAVTSTHLPACNTLQHGDAWIHLHNCPHHGPGHGGVSPSHPSSCGSPELGRNPFLVQRVFGQARREKSRDPWASAGEKQGFKLHIEAGNKPLFVSLL